MSSGFFGEQNMRDMRITAGILVVILISLFSAFLGYTLFKTIFVSVVALPLYAVLSSFAIFGPSENRAALWSILATVSLLGLLVGGLMNVEATTYRSIFTSIWNFVVGLICSVILLFVLIGIAMALMENAKSAVPTSIDSNPVAGTTWTPGSDDDENDDRIYKVDQESVEELIDALNEDEIDPDDIEFIIDDGAKNARISFRYMKPNERARRRKVMVKKVDGDCLGCIDLSDRSYKNFRLDRISDVRLA